MTDGQQVKLKRASQNIRAIKSENIDTFEKKKYAGKQVIVNSDRLVFNAKEQEAVMFAAGGIGMSTPKSIAFDSGKKFVVNAPAIDLGLNAREALVLGNTLVQILTTFLNQLTANSATFVATPAGPGVLNPTVVQAIATLTSQLTTALSTQNKTL